MWIFSIYHSWLLDLNSTELCMQGGSTTNMNKENKHKGGLQQQQ